MVSVLPESSECFVSFFDHNIFGSLSSSVVFREVGAGAAHSRSSQMPRRQRSQIFDRLQF
jgi:hypothetical protein